jgi:hypothetical protein
LRSFSNEKAGRKLTIRKLSGVNHLYLVPSVAKPHYSMPFADNYKSRMISQMANTWMAGGMTVKENNNSITITIINSSQILGWKNVRDLSSWLRLMLVKHAPELTE